MPALARADRLTEKASRIGFDWPDAGGARAKVAEELGELDEAIAPGDRDAIEHELGDVLFALANLSRKLGVPPEEALRGTIARFVPASPTSSASWRGAASRTGRPPWTRWTPSGTRRRCWRARQNRRRLPQSPRSPQGLGKERE